MKKDRLVTIPHLSQIIQNFLNCCNPFVEPIEAPIVISGIQSLHSMYPLGLSHLKFFSCFHLHFLLFDQNNTIDEAE